MHDAAMAEHALVHVGMKKGVLLMGRAEFAPQAGELRRCLAGEASNEGKHCREIAQATGVLRQLDEACGDGQAGAQRICQQKRRHSPPCETLQMRTKSQSLGTEQAQVNLVRGRQRTQHGCIVRPARR